MHVRLKPIPRPLVAPQIRLGARNGREAQRDQQATPGWRRGLGEIIGAEKSRAFEMFLDVAKPERGAPVAGQRPDVDRRGLLVPPRQQLPVRRLQVDGVEQQRVMPAMVEIKERDAAE